jgi:hypothetical protein
MSDASAFALPAGTGRPFSPSRIASALPPTGVAVIAHSHAIPSSRAFGNPIRSTSNKRYVG